MTSAEQKAKEIFSQLSGMEQRVIDILRERKQPLLARWQYDEAIPLITTAILEAENAKLEEAARLMESVLADSKAELIRSLISKKEPIDLVKIGIAALERGLNSKPKD